MVYFAFFYFLLVLSTHLTGIFNAKTIAPLAVSYGALLYYFFKYTKDDNVIGFSSEVLGSLLAILVAFEFDNIIAYLENYHHFLPVSVNILICLCFVVFLICIAGVYKFIPVFTKNNLCIACISILIMNALFIFFAPKPGIDVYVHLKEAVEYFFAFKNPYSNIYTQIYSPEKIKLFYYDDPVFLKYVPFQSAPPVTIALSAIGALLGDIRMIGAILFCMCPLLIRNICSQIFPALSDNTHKMMAFIPLAFPAQLHLIFLAWTDMSLGFFLILFIYFFINKKTVASYAALGVFLSLKQYSIIYLIPFLFIMNIKDWRLYFVTGGIVILPLAFFALWDFNGFIDSILLYELKQPFREDSISIAVLLLRYLNIKLYSGFSNTIILLSSMAVSVYCSFKKLSILNTEYKQIKFMLYVVLFQFSNLLMFSKQSFLNQYYFLILVFYLTMLFSIQREPEPLGA
jgi:hypothetical protein